MDKDAHKTTATGTPDQSLRPADGKQSEAHAWDHGILRELLQMTRIRVLLFLREPEAVFWVFMFPLVLAMVLGWAFNDRGPSPENVGVYPEIDGREAIARLQAAKHLEVKTFTSLETAERALNFGQIAVLVLPGDPPTLRYDPQRPEGELARLRVERALARRESSSTASDFLTEEVHETGSRYIDWLFPGLLGMNIMSTGIWGIGFGLAEIRQKKLLRRFLVTPMRKSSFLLSFILSRMVFLVMEVTVLLLFALFVLGVPLRGSIAVFTALVLVGTVTFSGLGILVASRARTIEGISGIINFVMMPMWLFSGVFFSYDRFPEAFHPLIQALPLTALNDALRSLMLEGAEIGALLPEAGILLGWGIGCFLLGMRIFRWE